MQLSKYLLLVLVIVTTGCRGYRSPETPIHLNPNLDFQAKFKTQSLSLEQPKNTIPWGTRSGDRSIVNINNDSYHTGKTQGVFLQKMPVSVDEEVMALGEKSFNIYCSVCHGYTGNGETPVIKRGFVAPPKLSESRLVAKSDGYIFDVITNGVRNMPGYKSQIDVQDRWAIVLYVRALQKMYNGKLSDIPQSQRSLLKGERNE